jgi:transcriptional regulator with XRE-family HTH domain
LTKDWFVALEEDEEGRRVLEQERLILEVTEAVAALMRSQKVSRAELARRIEKSPAFVTKMLRGDNNFTLRTLSDIFFAMDRSVHVSLGEIGDDGWVLEAEPPTPLFFDPADRWRRRGTWQTPAEYLPSGHNEGGNAA